MSGFAVVSEQSLPFKNSEHDFLVVGGARVVVTVLWLDTSVISVEGDSETDGKGDLVDVTLFVVMWVGDKVDETMTVVPLITFMVVEDSGG